MNTRPAQFFVEHPAVYVIAIVASAGTAVFAARRARREPSRWRRVAFAALAANCAAQCAGMIVTTEAVRAKGRREPDTLQSA